VVAIHGIVDYGEKKRRKIEFGLGGLLVGGIY